MKNTITLIFFGLSSIGFFAQVLPKNELGKVEYTEVIKVDSTSKNSLYSSAQLWFVETFKDAKSVIQLQDKENGELIGKGLFYIPTNRFGYTAIGLGIVRFQVQISVKEGRYKYSFSNFTHEGDKPQIYDCGCLDNEEPTVCSKKIFAEVKEKTDAQIKILIASLKRAMEENKGKKADDW